MIPKNNYNMPNALEGIDPFWANLVQKVKIVCLRWKLANWYHFKYTKFNGDVHIFFLDKKYRKVKIFKKALQTKNLTHCTQKMFDIKKIYCASVTKSANFI